MYWFPLRSGLADFSRPMTVTFPTAPSTTVSAKGDIIYAEVVREDVRKLEQYVKGA